MVKLRIIMRKFSIIRHYFITPGRYSCPGVSPARGGWPWNAGNAPVCGGAGEGRSLKVGSGSSGFGDGSGNGFGSWWLQGWFQGRFPGGGAGWFRSGSGRMRGRFPGVVSGAGTGMAAGRRTGMCGRDGLGLPGAARGREYTDFSGGRYALIILFVADY